MGEFRTRSGDELESRGSGAALKSDMNLFTISGYFYGGAINLKVQTISISEVLMGKLKMVLPGDMVCCVVRNYVSDGL